MATLARPTTERIGRLFIGLLLVAPACLFYGLVFWYPSLRTLQLSLQAVPLAGPATWAGLTNYAHLGDIPGLAAAWLRGAAVGLVRAAAVLLLPAVTGLLWARTGRTARLLARLALSLPLALSCPVALAFLWQLAVRYTPTLRTLQPGSLLSYLCFEFEAFLALGGALAALTLLAAGRGPGAAQRTCRLLFLAALLALVSGPGSLSLPFALGSAEATTPAVLAFRTAFQRTSLGAAAAQAVLLLVPAFALALALAGLCVRWRLRLAPAAAEPGAPSRPRLALALGALALLVLPSATLYSWSAGVALLAPGRVLGRAAGELLPGLGLANGAIVPALAVALVQLPAAYLAAFSLSLVRPFGARGSRVAFALLLASACVPPLVTALGLAQHLQAAGLLNSFPALGLPFLAGPAGLLVFWLYFQGQADPAPAGLSAALTHLWGKGTPGVAALAGVLSLTLAAQDLAWPLVTLTSRDRFTLSLQLLTLPTRVGGTTMLAAASWLTLTFWGLGFLALWWLLSATVLDRWVIEDG